MMKKIILFVVLFVVSSSLMTKPITYAKIE